MNRNSIFSILLLFGLLACGPKRRHREYMPHSLHFAHRDWWIKSSPEFQGPGSNVFSYRNVWVDWQGHLHLKVKEKDNRWTCAEVYTKDSLGYGRYEMEVEGPLGDLDPYLVFGFFTWDPHTFEDQANSEIDIEFSRWGFPLAPRVLHYSVHPVSLQKLFLERFQSSNSNPQNWNGRSRHIMEWRDTSITFYSYRINHGDEELLESFHYSFKNPPRKKGIEGQFSEAITVPKPGESNQARFNLWILGAKGAPLKERETEIVIRDFRYQAY